MSKRSTRKINIATASASFRTSKIMLILTWRLNYGGAVTTSITALVVFALCIPKGSGIKLEVSQRRTMNF